MKTSANIRARSAKLSVHIPGTVALVALLLGSGRSTTSAATATWSGASGGDLYWSTPGNWNPPGVPGIDDLVFFNDDGATSISGEAYPNNLLSINQTVANVIYGNTNGFHNTVLEPGVTLTISNNAAGDVLFVGTGADNGANQIVTATISGSEANFVVLASNAGSQFNVRQGSVSTGSHRATLDLFGLGTLDLTAGRLLVGGDGAGFALNKPQGSLILARTNVIRLHGTAPSLNVGDCTGSTGSEFVDLGLTNAIFTDSLTIARQKCTATLQFNPAYAGSGPTLFLRGMTSDRVSAMAIGDNSGQTTSAVNSEGMVDLSAGTVDALVNTCYVARGINGTGSGKATGTLTLGAGLFEVNTLNVGYVNTSTAKSDVTGTVTVTGAGTLVINDTLQLGRNPGATAIAKATLNVNNGTVRANSITTTTGNVDGQIIVDNGTLTLTNFAGTLEAPLTYVQFSGTILEIPVQNDLTNIVTIGGASTSLSINIQSLPTIMGYPVQYPLISYSYGSFDVQLGTLPEGSPSFQGYISNNLANSTIDLVITDGPPPPRLLTWNGTPTGNWDTSTTNWLASGSPTFYRQMDEVVFDDTAADTTTVNLTTALSPLSITVNNSAKSYLFTGPGSLSGMSGLMKDGAGMLTVANSGINDFVGDVMINAGTVLLSGSADRLPTNAAVILADQPGAMLDLNNLNQTLASVTGGGTSGGNLHLGNGLLTLAGGSGDYRGVVSGNAGVVKADGGVQVLGGANLYSGGTRVTGGKLSVANPAGSGTGSGSVVVETNGTFSIGAGGPNGSVSAPVITNNGTVQLDRSDDFTLANSIAGWGDVVKANTNLLLVPISNTYTGQTRVAGGALRVSHPQALGDATGQTYILNAPEARLELIDNVTLFEPLLLAQKQSAAGRGPAIVNVSGTNTLAGQIDATSGGSYWTLRPDGGKLIVSGVFNNITTSGNRYLRLLGEAEGDWKTDYANNTTGTSINHLLKEDGGTWTLSEDNTYGGGTFVAGGLLLVNGSIQNSSSVLVTNGTLGGTGVIRSPVTVGVDGTLAPGTSIGTLTISNTLSLNGTTKMEVSPSGADKVAGLSSVTFGGILKIVVVGTLNGTETFKLFEADSYSGDFIYDLPPLDAPLAWDVTSVLLDGTLRVTGGVEPPQIGTAERTSDGNFQLAGSGPIDAPYRILATSDVALPLSSWVEVGNGTFTSGAFSFTDLNATNYLLRFYMVVTP